MALHEKFNFKNLSSLEEKIRSLNLNIPLQDDISNLFERVKLDENLTLPNRFVVHPMEGFDADENGAPGRLAFRRYIRYAKGGSGLIWAEACAVVHEGRSNPHQFWINKENVGVYKELVSITRKEYEQAFGKENKPVIILQLTHSGRYSRPEKTAKPIIAHHSKFLDPKLNLTNDYPLVTDEYLDALQDKYLEAAKLASMAGFDGVDLKSCHRYLLSELLASFTRENSRYGGSFENRTRMLLETLKKIKKEVPELHLTVRVNSYDAMEYPYGFGVLKENKLIPDLTEPIKLIGELKKIGLKMINVSSGNPYYEAHFTRPYDIPIRGVAVPEMHPLENIDKIFEITKKIQNEFPELLIVGTGYSWLRQFFPNAASAAVKNKSVSLIGLGRSSFAYPDSVKDLIERGRLDPNKVCVTCSFCTQFMRDGVNTGCVVRDSGEYKKY
jgi:2,4-dienoyl-CoA reductase (NADPH2)